MTAHRSVSGLTIFPIKSCRGIDVTSASLEQRGFRFDRRWMIADEAGRFLTQREYPRLSLVGVDLGTENMTLEAPGMPTLTLPAAPSENPIIQVQIWDDVVEAMTSDRDAAEWISTFLDAPSRFVYLPDTTLRRVNPRFAHNDEVVSFADAFPVLLISEASLSDLNSRLQSPLPMNRFRPNVTIAGCTPYEEDTWKEIQIGSVVFAVAKPCSRCATTTVDQSTGIRGEEPLRTLSKYRNRDGKVHFGQNLIHKGGGMVHVGDEVNVLA